MAKIIYPRLFKLAAALFVLDCIIIAAIAGYMFGKLLAQMLMVY